MVGDRPEDLLLVHGDHPRADRLEGEEGTRRDLHDLAAQDGQIHMDRLWALRAAAQQCLSQLDHRPCIRDRAPTQNLTTPAAR